MEKSKWSRDYTKEEKDEWYRDSHMSTIEKKYCRCLLEQHADELHRYGIQKTKAYAVCSASIGRKSAAERKRMAQKVRAGCCTIDLHLETLPTPLIYSYCMLRKNTKKGAYYFPSLPTPKKFFENPEHFRVTLLYLAKKYQQAEKKKEKETSPEKRRKEEKS